MATCGTTESLARRGLQLLNICVEDLALKQRIRVIVLDGNGRWWPGKFVRYEEPHLKRLAKVMPYYVVCLWSLDVWWRRYDTWLTTVAIAVDGFDIVSLFVFAT